MPDGKNELEFTATLDSKPLIAEAKKLNETIKSAMKAGGKSDNPTLKKALDLLRQQRKEREKLSNSIRNEDTFEKDVLKVQQDKLALARKNRALKEADKAVQTYTARAEGKYRGRTDDYAIANAENLAIAKKNYAELKAEAERLAESVAKTEEKLISSVNNAQAFVDKYSSSADLAKQMLSYLDGTEKDTSELESTLERVTASMKGAANEAEQIETAFDSVTEEPVKIDLDADTASMSLLKLINYYRQLKEEKKQLETKQDITSDDEQRYDAIVGKMREVEKAADSLKEKYKEVNKDAGEGAESNNRFVKSFVGFSKVFVSVSQAGGILKGVKAGIAALGTTSLIAGEQAREGLAAATAGLSLIIEIVARLLTLFQSVFNALKTLATAIWNAFKKVFEILKKVAGVIRDTIVKVAGKVKKAFESLFPDQSDLKRNLQMLTKYIFGVRSIFFLYRKFRGAIKEGIDNLVQFQSSTNRTNYALTELRTSLLYLKNAWAAAFAPIINAVFPILVQLLDLLAMVGNAIARFMAALFHQETVLQAVRVGAGDYAESLKSAGGSAKKAADEQKKLNDRLADFDDLNVLGKDKDLDKDKTPSGGGGGVDIPSPNEMFKRIETPVSKLADLLREAWETGEGFKLGKYIGERISEGLDEAHKWLTGPGRAKAMKLAHLVATTIDGILAVPDLGSKFGQVIADAINLGLDVIDEIIQPTRCRKIGEQIVEAFNTALPQVLPRLGTSIGNWLFSGISMAFGFIENANFSEWGTAFGEGINNFFKKMGEKKYVGEDWLFHPDQLLDPENWMNGWEQLGQSVQDGIVGLLDMAIAAINELDVGAVTQAISDFLGRIDKEEIKAKLKELWDSVFTVLGELFPETDFEGIKTTLENIWGVISTIVGAIKKIKFGNIINLISKALEKIPWDTIAEKINQILESDEFASFLSDLKEGVKLYGKFAGAILKFDFGQAKKILKTILFIVSTAAKVRNFFSEVGEFFAGVGNEWQENFNAGMDVFLGAIGSVKEKISEKFSQFVDAIKGVFGEFKENISSGFETLKDKVGGAIETIMTKFGEWKDNAKNTLQGLRDSVVDKFENIKSSFEDLKGRIADKIEVIKGKFGELKGKLAEHIEAIKEKFGEFKDKVDEKIDAVKSKLSEAKDKFLEIWTSIKDDFTTKKEEFIAIIEDLKGKFDFSDMWENVKSVFKGGVNSVIDLINGFTSKIADGINELINLLNGFHIEIPEHSFMGRTYPASSYGFNIPNVSVRPIPHLAQGAVIPPNREFMAVLGDQKSGTNIEAPLDVIKQAVAEELSLLMAEGFASVVNAINNKDMSVNIGDREIGKANARYVNQQKLARGTML